MGITFVISLLACCCTYTYKTQFSPKVYPQQKRNDYFGLIIVKLITPVTGQINANN